MAQIDITFRIAEFVELQVLGDERGLRVNVEVDGSYEASLEIKKSENGILLKAWDEKVLLTGDPTQVIKLVTLAPF